MRGLDEGKLYILTDDGMCSRERDVKVWAAWYKGFDTNIRVEQYALLRADASWDTEFLLIRTVFMGMNHNTEDTGAERIFEVNVDGSGEGPWFFSTLASALAWHTTCVSHILEVGGQISKAHVPDIAAKCFFNSVTWRLQWQS